MNKGTIIRIFEMNRHIDIVLFRPKETKKFLTKRAPYVRILSSFFPAIMFIAFLGHETSKVLNTRKHRFAPQAKPIN